LSSAESGLGGARAPPLLFDKFICERRDSRAAGFVSGLGFCRSRGSWVLLGWRVVCGAICGLRAGLRGSGEYALCAEANFE
jgi:hypothetical protein